MVILAADPHPTFLPIALLLVFTIAITTWMVVAVAKAGAPGPADTAVAYEHAWDHLDFSTLWNLSGPGLRDGRTRDQFVRDKLTAYRGESRTLAGLVRTVEPERVDINGPVARVLDPAPAPVRGDAGRRTAPRAGRPGLAGHRLPPVVPGPPQPGRARNVTVPFCRIPVLVPVLCRSHRLRCGALPDEGGTEL